jgi:hypothetical protein
MSEHLNTNVFSNALETEKASAQLVSRAWALSPSELNRLISMIDDSAYDLNEWARALIEFEVWCGQNNRSLQLLHQLEYLNCCSESSRGGVHLPLAFLLADFLKNNGVES